MCVRARACMSSVCLLAAFVGACCCACVIVRACGQILKSNEGAPNKKLLMEFISFCEQMGWQHWTAHYNNLLLKQFPPKQPLL